MSIVFNRVERANPQDRTRKKWYPVLKTVKKVSEKTFKMVIDGGSKYEVKATSIKSNQ